MTLILLAALGVAFHLGAQVAGVRAIEIGGKVVASTAIVSLAVAVGALESPYGVAVLVALCFSWIGDVALLGRNRGPFVIGLSAFLAAHVAYGVGFVVRGADASVATIGLVVLLIPATLVWRWLDAHVPERLRLPVLAYIGAICGMAGLSTGTFASLGDLRIPIGATLFWISDIGIARDRFVAREIRNRVVGLPLYYAAQVLLALTTAV